MTAPVLWWKGENNAVDSVLGIIGSWGVTEQYSTGVVGNCFDFNCGSNEIGITITDPILQTLFNPTGNFSVEFWLRGNTS